MKTKITLIINTVIIALTLTSCWHDPNLPTPISTYQKYLPTLTFDGKDYFDTGEMSFPLSFQFNSSQDANNDGIKNAEDNLENYIPFSIGVSSSGIGRTGLTNRQSNQRPSVYFHLSQAGNYKVYEYWYYYADNIWLNNHEHDWEKVFVYELNGTPTHLKISNHDSFNTHKWTNVTKDGIHPLLGVDGGSHAFKIQSEDGAKIRYNGEISQNNGQLAIGNGSTIPWFVYSNDLFTVGITHFDTSIVTFYYGDPFYITNANEFGDNRDAPWGRTEWNTPPQP